MLLQKLAPGLKGQSIKVNGNLYSVSKDMCVDVEDEADVQKLLSTGWSETVVASGRPNPNPKPGPRAKVPSSLSSAKEFVALVARDDRLADKASNCQTFSELLELAQGLGYGFTKRQMEQAREAFIARHLPDPPVAKDAPNPKDMLRQQLEKDEAKKQAAAEKRAQNAEGDEDEMSSPQGRYSKNVLAEVAKKSGLSEEDILNKAFEIDQAGDQNGYYKAEEFAAAANALLEEADDGEFPAELPDGTPAKEWPDPDKSMKMDYLRKMADAYQVKHEGVKKADLIPLIHAAMYDGD